MKKTVKRLLSCFVALLMVLSVSVTAFAFEEEHQQASKPLEAKATASYDLSGMRNGKTFDAGNETAAAEIAADQIVKIMVELEGAPAMEVYSQYKSAQAYASSLRERQEIAVKDLKRALNVDVDVIYYYTLLFNGFAFEGEYRLVEEINNIEGMSAFVAAEWDCPDIQLYNSADMVGAIDAWDLDYTGEGTAIAIVDTGLMVDHPAFSTAPENVRFTRDDIAEIIASGQLHGTGATSMVVNSVYRTAKIPFRWNYYRNYANVAHAYNDHGTHVAGIAAGNGGEIQGIAKDAQIVAMQVFADTGGAGWTEILAALEDCVVLGVDAANLSLGSPCGFTDYYSPSYAATFENLVNAGVNLSMSAGNENTTAQNNYWGYPLVMNADYGVVGSPSTWVRSLSIASVDNSKSQTYTIQNVLTENLYSYTENSENVAQLVATFGGQTLDFVAVPGYGEVSDYAGLDVTGKVALVSRGETTFVEKGQNAQAAGAIACIIYNNTDGSINMVSDPSITIPFVFVLKESGDEMAAQGEGQILINTEMTIMDVPGGGQPSSFSSWGPTSDLHIKPEITAPGGNIYSSTDPRPTMSGAYYQAWSGTSMSAPHVAGGMAIVTNYVNDMFPNATAAEKQNLVDTILMSTADPVVDAGGDLAAVRSQGAGLMDLASAVTTTSYITVPGSVRPKLELGDDPEKTGVYEMTFVVNNFGEENLVYEVDPYILVDDIAAIAYGPDASNPYVIGRIMNSWDVTAYCDIEAPDSVTVPAGGETEVTVVVTLTEDIIEYFEAYYPTGNYVEGFIELYGQGGMVGDVNGDGQINTVDALAIMRHALEIEDLTNVAIADVNGDGLVNLTDALLVLREAMNIDTGVDFGETPVGTDLNVPFLAYYGDWNYIPMFDQGFYYEDFYWGSQPDYPNLIGSAYGPAVYGLGVNPYYDTDDLSYYNEDRNAVSPNNDGFLDSADFIRLGLMRNASEAGYDLITPDGEVIQLAHQNEVRKSFYYSSGEYYTNLGTDMGLPRWDGSPYIGEDVAIRAYAYLANDGSVTTEPFTEDTENYCNEWIVPVYVDGSVPTAEVVSFANGVLTLNVTDDHYVAYVAAFNGSAGGEEVSLGDLIDEEGLFEEERGMTTEIVLEGVSAGNLICMADYAGNEIAYVFDGQNLVEAAESWSHSGVSVPILDMYAYGSNLTSQTWVRFSTDDLDSLYYGGGITSDDGDYTCGTYTGTYVYAVDANQQLIRYDAEDVTAWSNKTTIGTISADYTINEMAYNKADGNLYIVVGLADLYIVNPDTAQTTLVSSADYGIAAIDFGRDGTCYIVDAFGYFCTLDTATGAETAELGYYGVVPYGADGFLIQCGTYAEDYFFWVAADSSITQYNQIHLLAIKAGNGDYVDLGSVFDGLYPLCIFAPVVEIPEASIDPVDFYENFEGAFTWELIDADEDGNNWETSYWSQGLYYDGAKAAVSYSWRDSQVLYPDNWMISPSFEIGEGEKYLSFFTASANSGAGADIDEHYQVIVIPEGMDVEDGIVVFETTLDTARLTEHVIDMADFTGETVQIAFRHFDSVDEYTLIIDAVGVGDML